MQAESAMAPRRRDRRAPTPTPIPWQEKPFQTMGDFKQLFGGSTATAYRLGREGEIELVSIGGRTLITTASLVALAKKAKPWEPGKRGEAGRRKRAENAAQRWR